MEAKVVSYLLSCSNYDGYLRPVANQEFMVRIYSAVIALILLGACAPTPQVPKTDEELRIANLDKEGRARGFQPVVRQDGRYYCHTFTPTNSHIQEKECITESQLEDRVRHDPSQDWGRAVPGYGCKAGVNC
jgi:hypothetical protein